MSNKNQYTAEQALEVFKGQFPDIKVRSITEYSQDIKSAGFEDNPDNQIWIDSTLGTLDNQVYWGTVTANAGSGDSFVQNVSYLTCFEAFRRPVPAFKVADVAQLSAPRLYKAITTENENDDPVAFEGFKLLVNYPAAAVAPPVTPPPVVVLTFIMAGDEYGDLPAAPSTTFTPEGGAGDVDVLVYVSSGIIATDQVSAEVFINGVGQGAQAELGSVILGNGGFMATQVLAGESMGDEYRVDILATRGGAPIWNASFLKPATGPTELVPFCGLFLTYNLGSPISANSDKSAENMRADEFDTAIISDPGGTPNREADVTGMVVGQTESIGVNLGTAYDVYVQPFFLFPEGADVPLLIPPFWFKQSSISA